MLRPTDAARLALVLSAVSALPCLADNLGTLNPEEGGLASLTEKIRGRPETAGFACWIAYETQKGGMHPEALAAMQLCAAEGNAPSMILLAHAYENGLGVPQDATLATLMFKRAAESGYSTGQFHYAIALREGRGLPKDEGQARFWLMQAAAGGDSEAALVLSDWPMS